MSRLSHEPPPDFEAIARAALPYLQTLCERWLPQGKRIRREWCCGSLRGDSGQSCRVNLTTGRWADFATGEVGGDAISLTAAIHHISQAEAARRLADMLGMNPEGAARA